MNDAMIASRPGDSTSPLTDWKKEPSVMDLKEELKLAKDSHDSMVSKIENWIDLRDVTGNHKPKKTKSSQSQVQPKLVRRQAEWRYSALSEPFLSAERLFDVSPVTWEDKEAAEQNALLLEKQTTVDIDRVRFIDEVVRTTVDEGTCFIRSGWDRETINETVNVPVFTFYTVTTQEELQTLQYALQLSQEDPNGFSQLPEELQEAVKFTLEHRTPVLAKVTRYEKQVQEKIIRNRPTAEILDYHNVYIDPTCNGDLNKARFVIISFETSKAELLKDGRYKNLDKVNWSGANPLHEPDHNSPNVETRQFKDELRKRVVAFEYWGLQDIEGNETLTPVVATWVGDTMVRMEENPFPDKKPPLVVIPYMPIKKKVNGEADAELLEENQQILGAVTRGMIDLLGRSANGQTGFAKGMLDVVNRRRYDNGSDYEFNPNAHPAQSIHTHEYPDIPNSALTMLQLQNQEAEAISGVKAFSGGLSGEAYGDVAAGIKGMLDASAKREMAILRRLAQGIADLGRKFISMNAVFLSDEEIIRVTNENFVAIRREDLQGHFDLKVDITTAEIDEAKAQDLSFMLQTMGNTLEFGIVKMILIDIAKLRRMPTLAKQIEGYEPQPDPMDQQLKQLEIAKAQKEIEELDSKILLNRAKARETGSNADTKDLNFLEQQSGATHARDMQKQAAQANANKELEVTKAILGNEDIANRHLAIADAIDFNNISKSLTN